MTETVQYRFLCRRGTAAALAAANEVPLSGEIYKELDTGREKTGDGTTHYNDLPYSIPGPSSISGLADGDAMVWNESLGMYVPGAVGANFTLAADSSPTLDPNSSITLPSNPSKWIIVEIGGVNYLIPAYKTYISGEWTPDYLATPVVLWNTEAGIVDDGSGKCSTWNDASTSAAAWAQGTSGSRPTINASGLNGLKTLTFNGTSSWMSNAVAVNMTKNKTAFTLFALCKPTPKNGYGRLLNFSIGSTSNSSIRCGLTTDTPSSLHAYQRRLDSDTAKTASTAYTGTASWQLLSSEHDWTNQTVGFRQNGGALVSTATAQGSGATSNTASTRVEMGGSTDSSSQYVAMDMAEIIALPYIPSTDDRQRIEGYLLWRGGLQSLLPSDHPYKNGPP